MVLQSKKQRSLLSKSMSSPTKKQSGPLSEVVSAKGAQHSHSELVYSNGDNKKQGIFKWPFAG